MTRTPITTAEAPASTVASSTTAPPLLRRLIDLDTAFSLQIHTACLPVPRLLLKALEISGDGRLWFPIPIALLPLSSSNHPLLLGLLLGFLLDLLLVGLLKHLVRRPRPIYNKGMNIVVAADHWSFPSGHSSRVFFIAAFLRLSLSAGGDHRWWWALVPLVFLWSSATSVSRVLLGRHFVLDVAAGSCLGVLEALAVFYFMKMNSGAFEVLCRWGSR